MSKPCDIVSIIISCLLFLLYLVYYYFNFNVYITDAKSTNVIWLYLSGYGKLIVKVMLSLFSFYILIMIIAIIILTIKTMFSSEMNQIMNLGASSSIDAENTVKNKNQNIYLYCANSIARYTIATIMVPNFIIIFFMIIPIYLLIITYFYKNISDIGRDKISNHLAFHVILSLCVGTGVLFSNMYILLIEKNPK